MSSVEANPDFFKSKVLGHPSGLFVLFFTEMWERFSFYGMRVLLVLFLTAAVTGGNPGWGWSAENAGALYGTYAMLLYVTPIFGGVIADKLLGYRWSVVIGAALMTLGHASMTFNTPASLYIGLGLLVIGTGFFKPNMTSILSEIYKSFPEKKDGAYTIFYMGVNAGAFFGMMLCGYVASELGWHYGFGLAGVFMLLGTIQFWLAKPLFGTIGGMPKKNAEFHPEIESYPITEENEILDSPHNNTDTPEEIKEAAEKLNPFTKLDIALIIISTLIGLAYALNDPMSRIGGVNLFPFTVGNMSGNIFMVLIALAIFFYLVISRLLRYTKIIRQRFVAVIIFAFFTVFFFMSFEQGATSLVIFARDNIDRTLSGGSLMAFNIVNTLLTVVPLIFISWVLFLLAKQTAKRALATNVVLIITFMCVWAIALWMLTNEFSKEASEIDASWFSILNSFFIIVLASTVSKLWDSKYNPPAAYKYGLGLIIMAIGFGVLSFGSYGITDDTMKASMIWLVLAYLFHTLGELFLSPVGLSYVSKLVPPRMIGFMFGMWYIAIAIGNKLAAILGGQIENITKEYSLSAFFLIFTIVPIVAGIIAIALNPVIKKLMHGVK